MKSSATVRLSSRYLVVAVPRFARLAIIVDGVGAFRTHAGDAHGQGPDAPSIERRHARLAVHAAHTVVTFILANWTVRSKRQ
jgi:hypothetical protein